MPSQFGSYLVNATFCRMLQIDFPIKLDAQFRTSLSVPSQ